METIAPYGYLVGGLIFFLFLGFITNQAGPTIVSNAPEPPTFHTASPDTSNIVTYIYNIFVFGWDNLAYFFTLMTMSSTFTLIGVFILFPFLFLLGITVLQIIGGLIP